MEQRVYPLCVTSKILQKREDGTPVPFEETLRFLTRAGFAEIDMSLEPPEVLQQGWRQAFEEKLRLCDQMGVRVRYAHLPYHYPKDDDASAWDDFALATRRAIDLAKMAGADCAAIHPHSFAKMDYDPDQERTHALRFLEPYQNHALQRGFPLALENMRGPGKGADPALRRFGTEVDVLLSVADTLQMGVCWDTGHGNISGQAQFSSITKIGKRLKMVHLNDNFADDDVHLAPFLGRVHWQEVVDGLQAVNYHGALNLEVHCNALPDALRELYALLMGAAAKKLQDMMNTNRT